ncbi:MAG TPA: glutamine--fructose-6-phosphate transaminase (isomerizing) [Candidatus Hungatella pullicola]|nr:glutamine--fructose-6-phosphate transaminase (isomerizing) [Candidatus Hungatella pullicola]
MCGIIGYTGPLSAKEIILNGLTQLEYRGYDSAGIALCMESSYIRMLKKTGKVSNLKEASKQIKEVSHSGIGHTRWATHGCVSENNTHPHQAGRVTLVHNGIIENYHQLICQFGLEKKLKSETDSEVAAWILDSFYQGDPAEAIGRLLPLLEGSYSFCIMFEDCPGEIYAVRSVSPLVAAYTHSGALVASDLTALIPYSRQYFVLPEKHLLKLTAYSAKVYTFEGREIMPEIIEADWNMDAAMKHGFSHFMLKEIHEQPEALNQTILPRLTDGIPDFSQDGIPDSLLKNCTRIQIAACGTAMHAGMAARALIEPLVRIPVTVSIASEFRYEEPLIDKNTLVIIISQSGETIDTLAALRLAKNYGSPTLSVVNVKGSTIARESDYVLYTHAGPEIAVASTKAYSVQLAALYLLSCRLAYVKGRFNLDQAKGFTNKLLSSIPAMKEVIKCKNEIQAIGNEILSAADIFFIGRGLDYSFSLEGALKLKEISYIHAEAYAAGELKHGTIALISPGVPVVAIATQERILGKTLSNVKEVKARGAFVILITKEETEISPGLADVIFRIPQIEDRFTIFPIAAVLQLIAYFVSVGKGLDVDQPRNLAKSVTVE